MEDTKALYTALKRAGKRAEELAQQVRALEKMAAEPEQHAFALPPAADAAAKALDAVEAALAAAAPLRGWCAEAAARAEGIQERSRARLGGGISKALGELGLQVTGQLPELQAGVLQVELQFDAAKARIWFGPRVVELAKCDLEPQAVKAAVEEQLSSLRGEGFDAAAFHARLVEGWRVTAMRAGRVSGGEPEGVWGPPLLDVYREMVWLMQSEAFHGQPTRGRFREYGHEHFAYDLFRLTERTRGGLEVRMMVATREQTRQKGATLWVPRNARGDGTHFSALNVRRVES